ncbi:MAG: hypothetical protein VX737_03780 [Pseudomonadota bacterium]|nr:hypothetical protein [Pseudomonadota bacterium]
MEESNFFEHLSTLDALNTAQYETKLKATAILRDALRQDLLDDLETSVRAKGSSGNIRRAVATGSSRPKPPTLLDHQQNSALARQLDAANDNTTYKLVVDEIRNAMNRAYTAGRQDNLSHLIRLQESAFKSWYGYLEATKKQLTEAENKISIIYQTFNQSLQATGLEIVISRKRNIFTVFSNSSPDLKIKEQRTDSEQEVLSKIVAQYKNAQIKLSALNSLDDLDRDVTLISDHYKIAIESIDKLLEDVEHNDPKKYVLISELQTLRVGVLKQWRKYSNYITLTSLAYPRYKNLRTQAKNISDKIKTSPPIETKQTSIESQNILENLCKVCINKSPYQKKHSSLAASKSASSVHDKLTWIVHDRLDNIEAFTDEDIEFIRKIIIDSQSDHNSYLQKLDAGWALIQSNNFDFLQLLKLNKVRKELQSAIFQDLKSSVTVQWVNAINPSNKAQLTSEPGEPFQYPEPPSTATPITLVKPSPVAPPTPANFPNLEIQSMRCMTMDPKASNRQSQIESVGKVLDKPEDCSPNDLTFLKKIIQQSKDDANSALEKLPGVQNIAREDDSQFSLALKSNPKIKDALIYDLKSNEAGWVKTRTEGFHEMYGITQDDRNRLTIADDKVTIEYNGADELASSVIAGVIAQGNLGNPVTVDLDSTNASQLYKEITALIHKVHDKGLDLGSFTISTSEYNKINSGKFPSCTLKNMVQQPDLLKRLDPNQTADFFDILKSNEKSNSVFSLYLQEKSVDEPATSDANDSASRLTDGNSKRVSFADLNETRFYPPHYKDPLSPIMRTAMKKCEKYQTSYKSTSTGQGPSESKEDPHQNGPDTRPDRLK